MQDIGTEQTIYCPAFSENGRSIFIDNLFVDQQALAESPMKDRSLTPMCDSDLMRLLTFQLSKSVGLADRLTVAKGPEALRSRLSELAEEDVAHIAVHAAADADLKIIVEACGHMPLLTGDSGVAMPLPAFYLSAGLISAEAVGLPTPVVEDRTVILSGSCSAMTNRQVAAYIDTGAPSFRLDPMRLAKTGTEGVLSWLAGKDFGQAPLIYATADPESLKAAQQVLGVAGAGEIVERTLAACAVVARDVGAQQVIVADGETSGAVTQALGVDHLDIGVEILPGRPWTYFPSTALQMALTLRSSSFGGPTLFTDAQEVLNRRKPKKPSFASTSAFPSNSCLTAA